MKKFNAFVSAFLCVAMLCAMGMSAYAADDSASPEMPLQGEIEQSISKDMLQQNIQDIFIADEIHFVSEGIEEVIVQQDTVAMDANQPPVAELQVSILNPESMIGGKFTTQTQIAWLWSYNGQDFTYDPQF